MAKKKENIEISLKDFKTGQEDSVISALESLKMSQGWKFVIEVMELNIKAIEQIIISGNKDEDILNLYRERRECYLELLNTPQLIIDKLVKQDNGESAVTIDPYEHVDNDSIIE